MPIGASHRAIMGAASSGVSFPAATDFSAWSKQNGSVLSQTATGPDGVVNGSYYYTDSNPGGTGNMYITINLDYSTSTEYEWEFMLKAADLSWCLIYLTAFTTPANVGYYFDLGTGSIGSKFGGGTATPTMTALGSGWYSCKLTFTTDATDNNGNIYLYPADGDLDNVISRDGTNHLQLHYASRTPSS